MHDPAADEMAKPFYLRPGFWFWLIALASLAPWFVVRIQQATNSDILWLCEALTRVLAGGRMSDVAYETNPPLSLFIYTIPVALRSYVPLHYGTFLQTVLIMGASAYAARRIMRSWSHLDPRAIDIITAGFLLATSLGASLYFGERDHLIGLALFPFILLQITITNNWNRPKGWTWPIFAIGTIFILMKPHYGLLPSLLLLHRLCIRKNASVLKDPDFLCLAILTCLYAGLIAILFPDYLQVILPDVIALYVAMGQWPLISGGVYAILIIAVIAGIILAFLKTDRFQKNLMWFLLACTIVNTVPYVVQGMGFYYHLLPAAAWMAPLLCLLLFEWLKTQTRPDAAMLLTMIFSAIMIYIATPLNIGYARHNDYAHFPVSKTLDRYCPMDRPCTFFMFNRDMGILTETAYYTGRHHASRFPSFWFLPELTRAQSNLEAGKPSRLSREKTRWIFNKYATMVADDIATGKPDVILLWQTRDVFPHSDFIHYFSASPAFAKEWENYEKADSLTLTYVDYYGAKGTRVSPQPMTYEVYLRNENTKNRLPR